jgi:hypothetical protein
MARLRDEFNQTQQIFRALQEGFEQHLQQRDDSAAALNRLPELKFWDSLDERLGTLPPVMSNLQTGIADLSATSKEISGVLLNLNKPERGYPSSVGTLGNGHGDLKTLQVAVVEAIEKGFISRRPVVVDGVPSTPSESNEQLQATINLLQKSLDELLVCNRRIHQIMDESHIFRSAGQRFIRFWRRLFGRQKEVAA